MTNYNELRRLLERVFDDCREGLREELSAAEYKKRRFEFVFHMTDFIADSKTMRQLFDHPERAKLRKATTDIIGFLYHVIPHLKAAGRLLLDEIGDPFEEIPATQPRSRKRIKTKAG